MRKIIVLFLFLVMIICVGYLWSSSIAKVKLITSEQGSFLEMAQGLVEELNKLPEEDLPNKKIDFYVANFTNNNISKIRNKNHYNILYLGSRRGFDIEKIQGFDKIFVSTPDLKAYFEEQGINTEFLQISWKDKGIKADINNKDKWLLIGENSETEKELDDLGVNYDKINSFALENEKKILEKLSEIKGVIIENPKESEESLDFSPLVLEIIARKIPILTNSVLLSQNFNDMLSFYITVRQLDEYFIFEQYNIKKIDEAYEFIYDYFGVKIQVKRLLNIEEIQENKIGILTSILPMAYNTGDYWFFKDLGESLVGYGYKISRFFYDSIWVSKYPIIINVFLGGNRTSLVGKFIKLDLMLYPPDDINDDNFIKKLEVDDIILASKKVCEVFKNKKIRCYEISQYTNPKRFYPDFDYKARNDILFVGGGYERKSVQIALKHNFPITIYGANWQGYAKGEHIDNRILRKYYSSAKINLNDHREGMKKYGFINNRTFDVTASGGFLISDYMPEIEEIYGDSIPMWKTEEELVELLNYYLDPAHEEERLEKAARAREITLKNFTSDIVAEKFDKIIKELKKEKGL